MATKKSSKSSSTNLRTVKSISATAAGAKSKVPVQNSNAASGPVMVRRKEMVARIVAASGLQPYAVKSALDAVLAQLGNALSAGEALNLHPLGKVTVIRQKQMGDKEVLTCKIRRKLPQNNLPNAMETVAE